MELVLVRFGGWIVGTLLWFTHTSKCSNYTCLGITNTQIFWGSREENNLKKPVPCSVEAEEQQKRYQKSEFCGSWLSKTSPHFALIQSAATVDLKVSFAAQERKKKAAYLGLGAAKGLGVGHLMMGETSEGRAWFSAIKGGVFVLVNHLLDPEVLCFILRKKECEPNLIFCSEIFRFLRKEEFYFDLFLFILFN